MLCGMPFLSHAQPNDPKLAQQTYLETINVLDAWTLTGYNTVTSTAIVGPGNVLPSHEDLFVTIPQSGNTTPFLDQPPTSTFAGGIMHAEVDNGVGIAGIHSPYRLYSYEAGKFQDYEGIPNAVYAFDIGAATTHTYDAIDKQVDVILTPVAVFDDESAGGEVSTDLLASPISIPRTDLQVPSVIGDILEGLGGWLYEGFERQQKMNAFKSAHVQAASSGVFSVAPVGDFEGSETVWPASLSRFDAAFSVGGATEDGRGHWPTSAVSASASPNSGTLDVVAPAENVLSTFGKLNGQSTYGERNSTVGSAAMVAGVAGLVKNEEGTLQQDDLRQILRRTADDIPPAGYDRETGYGLLNAKAAVDYVRERTFEHRTVTDGVVTILDRDVSFTMTGSPWSSLGAGQYFAEERYKVEWTVNIPTGSDHDVWVRRPGTHGWTGANPTTGTPGATLHVRSWDGKATITTYGYQGATYDGLGRRISTYGYPVRASDARVAYTVATKPGTPPPPPVSVSVSGPSRLAPGETGTWTASPAGGTGVYSYRWYEGDAGGTSWTDTGVTTATLSRTYAGEQTLRVRVLVTSDDVTASDSHPVEIRVEDCSGSDCTIHPFRKSASSLALPAAFALHPSAPHPTRGSSRIRYDVPRPTHVRLAVYDVMGRHVAELVDDSIPAGVHHVRVDAETWPSGSYFVRMHAGAFSATERLTVVR